MHLLPTQRLAVLPWSLLLVHPCDHDLVPPHRRVTAAELPPGLLPAATIAGDAAALRAVLPSLWADDPVARYLAGAVPAGPHGGTGPARPGLQPGELVRIERHDGSTYFRVVVGVAPRGGS